MPLVQVAQKKLQGIDPVTILFDNLKLNANVKSHGSGDAILQLMKDAVEDSVDYNAEDDDKKSKSRRVNSNNNEDTIFLSSSAQVDTLIALATNDNILARQYEGLNTWLWYDNIYVYIYKLHNKYRYQYLIVILF